MKKIFRKKEKGHSGQEMTPLYVLLDTYWGLDSEGIRQYYSLTPEKAAESSSLTKVKTGLAIVGIQQSGDFYLISYDIVG